MTSPPGLQGAFEFLEHHLVFKHNTGSPEGSHPTYRHKQLTVHITPLSTKVF